MSVQITSGKGAFTTAGRPNVARSDTPIIRVDNGAAVGWFRMPVPGERGENVTQADLALTIKSSAASGAVTYTLRRAASKVPWSNLTWNETQSVGVVSAAVSVVVTDPAPGDVVVFDIAALAQLAIDGSHYGWRLTTSSSNPTRFYGFDSDRGPTLDLNVTDEPAPATDLVPNGVGSLSKPVLQWNPVDLNGGDDQTAFRVQIASSASPAEDANGIWTSPTYDSGTVADPTPELDLSATAYAGISNGGEFWWQVLWQSETGLWSPVSDTAHYERENKPAWTWANPTGGEVDSTQPTFEATFGGTLKAWRASVALASRPHRILSDSRKQRATSNTVEWQPLEMTAFVGDDRDPITLQDGETYRIVLEGWRPNSGGYVASVGDPVAVRSVVQFTVNEDTGIEAPVITGIAPHATLPLNVVTVTRSTMPDTFVLYRNGRAVSTVDADDAHVAGTTYEIPDALGRGLREHDYQVRAQVDGAGLSALSAVVSATITPIGVWLVSRDLSEYVQMAGTNLPEMARADDAGVFQVQGRDGRTRNVVIRAGRSKVVSSLTLELDDDDRPMPAARADLEAIWAADDWAYLIAADQVLKIRVLDVSYTPHEMTFESNVRGVVSLRYVEVG